MATRLKYLERQIVASQYMIGFLFMSYQDIEQRDVWSHFFSTAHSDQYRCFVHRKDGVTTTWLPNSMCIPTIKSEWGTWSLVEIEFALYRQAISAGCNYIILLSGDTVPLVTFDCLPSLMENTLQSCRKDANRCRARYMRRKHLLMCREWWGASQWKILDKETVCKILNECDTLQQCFEWSVIPDEHAIVMLLVKREIPFKIRQFCLANFNQESSICTAGIEHRPKPKTWHSDELVPEMIQTLRDQGYLFLRKTCPSVMLDAKVILGATKDHSQLSPLI